MYPSAPLKLFFCLQGLLLSFGCPAIHYADRVSLKFGDLPASVYLVLGLKACDVTPGLSKNS